MIRKTRVTDTLVYKTGVREFGTAAQLAHHHRLEQPFRTLIMALDKHGDLGAALIPFYLPFIPLTIYLAFRHGFNRTGGWVYLCTLAVVSEKTRSLVDNLS